MNALQSELITKAIIEVANEYDTTDSFYEDYDNVVNKVKAKYPSTQMSIDEIESTFADLLRDWDDGEKWTLEDI